MDCFSESTANVLKSLQTNADTGLTDTEVLHRQKQYGANVLTPPKIKSVWVRLFLQIHQPLIYVLLLSATLAVYFHEYIDAGVIYGVVLINALMGFYQEDKALKALMRLSQNVTVYACVLRGGRQSRIEAAHLVPGDIVRINSGDKIPADVRLLNVSHFQVDESPLTGESVPVDKQVEALPPQTLLAERTNMAYASTYATFGSAWGVVCHIGDKTEIGRITHLINKTPDLKTPLTIKIEEFSQKLLWLIVGFSVVSLVLGLYKSIPFVQMFMSAVAMAVAAIPEGLPAAMTIILAIGVGRMLKEKAIVRKLPSVETLGSTSVICSDKTGTLTENKMTVQQIFAGGKTYTVSGTGYDIKGTITPQEKNAALDMCLKTGILCTSATWVNAHKIEGDPTEVALLVSAFKRKFDYIKEQKKASLWAEIPFESAYKYMAMLRSDKTAYIKGSIEALLPKCNKMLDAVGKEVPLDKDGIMTKVQDLAMQGLRVLAFAIKKDISGKALDHDMLASDLVFVGLQAMIDPPRKEAIAAIEKCHGAGITIKMITGDYGITAGAIARQMNLTGSGRAPVVIDGQVLAKASDNDLFQMVEQADVFARVSPEDKLRLVRAIQKHHKIVAMTGDGVNDAPALKQANIGVAMGITGTDVAKEAADIVLMDDNFATIERAVEQGRGVFDNLVKFIIWTLPTSFAEALIVFIAVLCNHTIPMTAGQILWINMVTTILLGMMFSFEPIEKGIMNRAPRKVSAPIITRQGMIRILNVMCGVSALSFWVFDKVFTQTQNLAVAQTAVVSMIVLTDILFMFACRSWKKPLWRISWLENRWMLWGALGMVALQGAFIYAPWLQFAFKTGGLNATAWMTVVLGSLGVMLMLEIEKAILRSRVGK